MFLKAVDAGAENRDLCHARGRCDHGVRFHQRDPAAAGAPQVRAPTRALSWADKWTDQGWIEGWTRKPCATRRYANVFGIGDINGVPKGKTAASVKMAPAGWSKDQSDQRESQGREGTQDL